MAQTYGEVLPASFPAIFGCMPAQEATGGEGGSQRLFVDLGSGHGALCLAAVGAAGGFSAALGVEKYRDKHEASLAARGACPPALQGRLTFLRADINDFDLAALAAEGRWGSLLLFCNNVAFNRGTIQRSGVQLRRFLEACGERGKAAVVVSMMPLAALADMVAGVIHLDTTWSRQHRTEVYGRTPG